MKPWNQPKLVSFNPAKVKSGGTGPALYEAYINLGSYGTNTMNGGGPWPCGTFADGPNGTLGCWSTQSFYFNSTGQGASSIAACDQAGFGSAGISGVAACT